MKLFWVWLYSWLLPCHLILYQYLPSLLWFFFCFVIFMGIFLEVLSYPVCSTLLSADICNTTLVVWDLGYKNIGTILVCIWIQHLNSGQESVPASDSIWLARFPEYSICNTPPSIRNVIVSLLCFIILLFQNCFEFC